MSAAEVEISAADEPLPIDVPALVTPPTQEEIDMPKLPPGAAVRIPALAGRWSVWSQSDETPGAYFVVPLDDEAKAIGAKYAVIRARTPQGAEKPTLTLIRTDPTIPGLVK